MKTLFAGDGNIDLQFTGLTAPLQTDREVTCTGFAATMGGSSTICAAAHALLGGTSDYSGLLGDDHYGHLMRRLLREAGVGVELLRLTAECPTGVTANLVYGSTRTQITYPGTLSVVDETDTILREMRRFAHIHLAGLFSLSRFLPHVREVLSAARAAGLTTSITTQWDPRQEWRGLEEWLPFLTYLFVNEEEAFSITGRRQVEEAYGELARRTECPVITRGSAGAFAAGRPFPAIPLSVKDPTGAGDTFAAGFLRARGELGMALDAAVRYACAAGAFCCTYTGGVSEELSHARVLELVS